MADVILNFPGTPVEVFLPGNPGLVKSYSDSAASALAQVLSLRDQTQALTDQAQGYAAALEAAAFNRVAEVATATTANITLSGAQIVGGFQPVAGDRIGVFGQTDAAQNGIYIYSLGAWSRAGDFDQTSEVLENSYVPVRYGANAGAFVLATAGPITVGTTAQTWMVYRRQQADLTGLAAIDVTVGPGGQFAQIPAALTHLSHNYLFGRLGLKVRIRLLAGFVMTEPVLVRDCDLSWIEIVSDDPTVPITGANMNATALLGATNRRYCFAALNAVLPAISAAFAFNALGAPAGVVGIGLDNNSRCNVAPGCGVTGVTGFGACVYGGSHLDAKFANFANSGSFGLIVEGQSGVTGQGMILTGCGGGARISEGAGGDLANADFSNAVGPDGNGLLVTQAGVVNAQLSRADNCSQSGFRGRGTGTLNLTGARSEGCQLSALYAERGLTVNADASETSPITPCIFSSLNNSSFPTIWVREGARVVARNAQITGRVQVEDGTSTLDYAGSTHNDPRAGGFGALVVLEGAHVGVQSVVIDCTVSGKQTIYCDNGRISGDGVTVNHTVGTGAGLRLIRSGEFKGRNAIIRGGAGSNSVSMDEAATLDAPNLQFRTNGTQGINAANGCHLRIPGSQSIEEVSPPTNRVTASGGTIIQAANTAWTCNLTANTLTAAGLLMR